MADGTEPGPVDLAKALVGCMDGFNATAMNGPGGFPVGTHEIDVTADGAIESCTFPFPLPKLSNGAEPRRRRRIT